MKSITEKELMQKVDDGVSKNNVWEKPLLLLTKDGVDYHYINDKLAEAYRSNCINSDVAQFDRGWAFIRTNGQLELSFDGVSVDGHNPDVQIYKYLGGALAYDQKTHRYCIDLLEYEAKPVISLICVTDKNCSIDNIPEWIKEEFEIALFVM